MWCPNFRVNLLSLRKEVMEYGSTVSFGTKTSGNALILSSGHSVPFFDNSKNYLLGFTVKPGLPRWVGASPDEARVFAIPERWMHWKDRSSYIIVWDTFHCGYALCYQNTRKDYPR